MCASVNCSVGGGTIECSADSDAAMRKGNESYVASNAFISGRGSRDVSGGLAECTVRGGLCAGAGAGVGG